jgi:hypothetical protein
MSKSEAPEWDKFMYLDCARERTAVMAFERRGFLKVATTGFALGCVNFDRAVAWPRQGALNSELLAGSGTVHLEGKLRSGTLTIDAQDFVDRGDRSVVVRSRLDSTELYSAMFSYQNDLTVFAVFRDNDHSTTIVLSDTDDPKIGRLVVWDDNGIPQLYDVDKNKMMATNDPKNIKAVNGKTPDLLGRRKPPAFAWQELETVFGSYPALLAFMRGRKTTHHPTEENKVLEWICHILSMVEGSTLSLFWLGH